MNLKNKNILLVGLAKTGVSTIKLLNKLEANIIVNDIKDEEKLKDILEELKEFEDNTIVAINYDNGMGYSIEYWTTKDKIN